MTPKFHPLKIAEVRRETADAISLRFDVPAELAEDYRFVQGQHLTLKARVNDEELRRSYSICAGVDDGELRVAIKKIGGGRFSTWAHDGLQAGDVIEVMTPEGRFHTELDPAQARHYVAFAAGSGITPILSLIKTTLKAEPKSRFTLIYGNRRQNSVIFAEALEDLKDRYMTRFTLYHVFSREEQEVPLFNGRLDRARVASFLDTLIPADNIDAAFICGPGAMIDEVEAGLLAGGLTAERIHLERFGIPDSGPAHHVEAGDAPQARITVIADGLKREMEFRATDPSILDVALRAGMDLPYSCKGGVCCTCRARVLEGKVRMDKNYTLEQPDVDAGFVLTCQAHPLTERVVISFDDR
ncbi:phenylacetate-CoA oxygenase/reductase subunit PaaK [Azoarcus communis]|uniref:Phenylacetate-CoA oxygenase/reductase subunit PaaK n=1 Tax=Parazoarcus communis SWub3 = DSM 12120 TaxID=1121029 RepID=A0A323UX91_9RHOO|nr:1,2-phenylacetyl-CoA epoxidase subunit PaaE [Parazoarcus communis]NMG49915.1 phenylacetate-CoA oxygenase/reductase subunit PaaK [Parazoarcus communis]NMG70856.1 phenylacetate-CoA oxygenase/reductase subunit PaaK [Parazoarcus communis SWub3 = DSM 12120]PZA16250.1 phenylacetate-CoA oxygenase/reductase subunit PaaK [Azoarcus communis] [Parazoarcus communis SWub3 = DSM 12120]